MTRILFVIRTIYYIQFNCKYLQNKKNYPQFLAGYLKYTSNDEQFEKKYDPHRLCILEIRACE